MSDLVISRKDLLIRPDEYKPLGSFKSVKNKESKPTFLEIDIEKVFKSDSNLKMMANSLHKVHRQNGGRSTIQKFLSLTPKLAESFSRRYDINKFEDVTYQATGHHNWSELLKTVNNEFMSFCYNKFRWNSLVPTREWAEVGATGERKQKRFYELTVEDIGTLDYWRKQETQRINKAFRHNNKIPVWQRSMHNRFYDKSNDGLHSNDPDRASLENFVHGGYDMDRIHELIDKWTDQSWFGMH